MLQNVNLANLYVTGPRILSLPRDAEVLAEFSRAPAIALLRKRGATALTVAFDPLESNWPYEPSFVMFLYNATAFLGMEDSPESVAMLKVGEPITASPFAPGQEATIHVPGLGPRTVLADPSGTFRFAGTTRAGLYTLQPRGANQPGLNFAVNMMDDQESFIAPAGALQLGVNTVAALDGAARRNNLELWPWLVAVVLLLVCAEWFIYNSRARL